ncbi:Type II secretory pathway, pseudopilin PulG [Jatrophihabitans endophyticus]|uniref:Type II secretory pathway, pseudopilin PulG n=1 Tax=Jatrophihabitans endophyticus TaxID=1206085 RepID=A0A1M5UFD6_9ACTN|nr:prepilin-type N-terminal cleavage/methylation domain-containing protein [Jatrophihabitans endophyticus]SHH61744.1 Type II secretory pathway, pseudopilin PulG [Jatrophihabitans endophyticus]
MPPTRVLPPLRRVEAGDDGGFTVVEALVAFVLLAVVSAAAIVAIANTTKTSKRSTDRVTAANLVQQDLQAARALRYPNYPAARSATTVVGTTSYTLTRSVSATTPAGATIGACPATPDFTNRPYMVVTTTVTWPPAGTADRVSAATELAC